jgi:hypothetical protein
MPIKSRIMNETTLTSFNETNSRDHRVRSLSPWFPFSSTDPAIPRSCFVHLVWGCSQWKTFFAQVDDRFLLIQAGQNMDTFTVESMQLIVGQMTIQFK